MYSESLEENLIHLRRCLLDDFDAVFAKNGEKRQLLIIFDLDDTLIDTSGTVTPFKLRESLKKLPIQNFSIAYEELLEIYRQNPRSKQALLSFLSRYPFDPILAQSSIDELSTPLPKDFSIPTTPYAKEILEFLRCSHTLALVTVGHRPFQLEKLEKARIDPSIFSKIVVPEDANKKPFYQALQKEFYHPPNEIWVCGDRVEVDLLPAYELQFKTVHMGRNSEPWVDHSITNLEELRRIIR